ncbi:MAG: glycoside hydrolase family 95 protein [Akkermansiaceae bacterium]|nr:glycoside hydrolase family 95 protein [Akkermansiaceae bacterium]
MHRLCALLLAASAFPPLAAEEIRSTSVAEKWQDGFPVAGPHLGLMTLTGTTSDRLMLFSPAATPPSGDGGIFSAESPSFAVLAAARKAGAEKRFGWLTPSDPPRDLAEIRVDWLDGEQPFKDFSRTLDPAQGVVTTRFTRGTSELIGKVFISEADDLTVIHLRADKPGSLSFKIRLERPGRPEATMEVKDRRVLILRGKTNEAADAPSFEVRAWVFPMESEVTPAEKDISVLGEGEALVLIATAVGKEGSPALTEIGTRLQKYGFGGTEHPDISELWDGLLERHLKAHRAAMAEKR